MTYQQFHATLKPDEQLALDERAAIMEFDGNLIRREAEREAMRDFEKQRALFNA